MIGMRTEAGMAGKALVEVGEIAAGGTGEAEVGAGVLKEDDSVEEGSVEGVREPAGGINVVAGSSLTGPEKGLNVPVA